MILVKVHKYTKLVLGMLIYWQKPILQIPLSYIKETSVE